MALTDNLVAYWKLDEASGNALDAHGSNELTDVNTVAATSLFSAARIRGARIPVPADSDALSTADNTDLSTGDVAFMFKIDVRLASIASTSEVLSKWGGTVNEYQLFYLASTTNRFRFQVIGSGTTTSVNADALGAPVAERWYTIWCYHDPVANEIGIRVNDGAWNTAAHTPGVNDSDGAFRLGTRADGALTGNSVIDEAVFWKGGYPTSDEQTDLWNEGLILPYPFALAPLADVADTLVSSNGYGGGDSVINGAINAVAVRSALASVTVGATTYQVTTFWDNDRYLNVAWRDRATTSWTVYTYDGAGGLATIQLAAGTFDLHEFASVGVDPDGYVHVTYDLHNDTLKYRKSDAPLGTWTGALTTTLSMLGTNESSVSYVRFFNDPSGTLYATFRDGGAIVGDVYFYIYDESTAAWSAATGTGTGGKLVDGKNESPTSGVYQLGEPRFDSDFGAGGFMHMAFHWNESVAGLHNVVYLKWDGASFYQADGTVQTVPVTQSNDEVVYSGTLATTRGAVDSDSDGHPHLVFNHDDGGGFRQVYHAYHDGATWTTTQITSATDDDTYYNSAPQIVIRRSDDSAFIWYDAGFSDGDGMYAYQSNQGDFTIWSQISIANTHAFLGYTRYDRQRFEDDGKVDLMIAPFRGRTNLPMPIRTLAWTLPAALGDPPAGDTYQPRHGVVMLGGVGML